MAAYGSKIKHLSSVSMGKFPGRSGQAMIYKSAKLVVKESKQNRKRISVTQRSETYAATDNNGVRVGKANCYHDKKNKAKAGCGVSEHAKLPT